MLTALDITVKYDGHTALADISVELGDGKLIALIGPNGSGKSTLIRTLNGTVIPQKGGCVKVGGIEIGSLSRREIAAEIAVVAQENETRFPVTVEEFVLSGRFVHGSTFGWETTADKAAAKKALDECGLADYARRLMDHLSGGERQRVVLARALASEAKILLLDEPTANLDVAHQVMMFRLVRERCRAGSSAIVITHDLNLAAEFADKIIMLERGRVAASGAPTEVLTADNLHEVFGIRTLIDKNPATGNVRMTGIF